MPTPLWRICAVSYTHLDVYKRQAMASKMVIASAEAIFPIWSNALAFGMNWSTNHTKPPGKDVYKRQMPNYQMPIEGVGNDRTANRARARCPESVSCTHLDVYKRQSAGFSASSGSPSSTSASTGSAAAPSVAYFASAAVALSLAQVGEEAVSYTHLVCSHTIPLAYLAIRRATRAHPPIPSIAPYI